MLYIVPPKDNRSVSVLPRVTVPVVPAMVDVPILPVIVISPSSVVPLPFAVLIDKLLSIVVALAPIAPEIVTLPRPESITKFSLVAVLLVVSTPLIVDSNLTIPSAVP